MKLTGEKYLAVAPDRVWAALIDPDFLGSLIPGCKSMTGSPEAGYDITVERSVGGLSARLSGRFDLTDLQPGRGCLLTGEGRGGAAGLAKGTARIRLLPEAGGTRLTWNIDADLGGKLAKLPDFVVVMAARKVADGFVERFAAAIESRPQHGRGWFGRKVGP